MADNGTTRQSDGLSEGEIRLAEAHRGFVREMDTHLGKAYGSGGAVVIAALCTVIAVGWVMGWLVQWTLWMVGITTSLAVLYVARRRIYARRDRLRQRVEAYCEANEIAPAVLEQYYASQDMYPFFAAIFEARRPDRLSDDRQPAES